MGEIMSDDLYDLDDITEAQQQQIYQIFNALEQVIKSKDLAQFVDFYEKNNNLTDLVEDLFMDYESENKENILTLVASYGTIEMFNFLLDKHYNITFATTKNWTALDCAIIYNKNELVEYIVEKLCASTHEISIIHSDLSLDQASIIAMIISRHSSTIKSLVLNNNLINDDSIAILFSQIKNTKISISFDNNEKIKKHPQIEEINKYNNSIDDVDAFLYLHDDNDDELEAALRLSLEESNISRVPLPALAEFSSDMLRPISPRQTEESIHSGPVTLDAPTQLSPPSLSSSSLPPSDTYPYQTQKDTRETLLPHPLTAAYASVEKKNIVRQEIKQWEQLVVSCFYTSNGDTSYAFKLFVEFEEELPLSALCSQYGVKIAKNNDSDVSAPQYILTATTHDTAQAQSIAQFLIDVQHQKGYASSQDGPDGLLNFIAEAPSLRSPKLTSSFGPKT
jgi:ankyrin repeat protein